MSKDIRQQLLKHLSLTQLHEWLEELNWLIAYEEQATVNDFEMRNYIETEIKERN